MNQREILEDKERVINILINSQDIVDLLVPEKPDGFIPEDLINNGIYDYYRVPDINEKCDTFITVVEEVPRLQYNNNVVKDKKITVTIISHDDKMKVKGYRANINDIIGSKVDELLNKNADFGLGYMELFYSTEGVLDTGHPFRSEVFAVQDLNSEKNKFDSW